MKRIPIHPHLQRLLQVLRRRRNYALATDPHRNVIKHRLGKTLLQAAVYVPLAQIRAQQSHAAVDVEACEHRGSRVQGVDICTCSIPTPPGETIDSGLDLGGREDGVGKRGARGGGEGGCVEELHIKRCHVADGKTVASVHVGQTNRRADDAR